LQDRGIVIGSQVESREEVLLQAYAESLKPHLARLMHAFGLDVRYHRARGDRMYYYGPEGEVEVLDFVGGFGASLLGHNYPELVELARELLAEQRPFHAQASVRGHAGLLAERLSSEIGRSTNRTYLTTLCNTGAEAVEAAIKHAELEVSRRSQALLADFDDHAKRLRSQIRAGRVRVSPEFLEEASLAVSRRVHSIDDLLTALHQHLQEILNRPSVFFALAGSFHGKSTGALKLTHRQEFRDPWRRLGESTVFLPVEDVDALRAASQLARLPYWRIVAKGDGSLALREEHFVNITAIFMEPIQGEGGIRELSPEFARALREAADSANCPLIIDEIQSGMGRCGSFLASTHLGIRGDYYLLSKALGGGLAKISALLVDRDRYVTDFSYLHTSTFADDDFSSILALRTLETLNRDKDRLILQCAQTGRRLLGRLQEAKDRFPHQIREVRGRGLMLGVELAPQSRSSSPLMRVLSDQNLLTYLACGYLLREHRIRVAPTLSKSAVLRVQPSVFISDDDIERMASALEQMCSLQQEDRIEDLLSYMAEHRPPGRFAPTKSPSASKSASPAGSAEVGFLVHFPEPRDLRGWEPGLQAFSDADCARILERTRGLLRPFILDQAEMKSARGANVHVTFIGIPFTAEQAVQSMLSGDDWTLDMVKEGVQLARKNGCTVVGLGGHTSIVSDNCRDIVDETLIVTSGNSLTVAAAWESCRLAAQRLGLDLSSSRMAVVGAAGNLGAVLAEIAADDVGEIVLVGRPGAERFLLPVAHAIYERAFKRLKRGSATGIAASIAGTRTVATLLAADTHTLDTIGSTLHRGLFAELGERAPLRLATSFNVLRNCHIIASCTSAPSPVILPEHVGTGPVVVCDVAVPQDVHPLVEAERPNALVIRGGRIWAPLGQTLDIPAMRIESSELYGCLAETILLGFAGPECPSSYGKLSPFRVRRVRELAAVHGFRIDEKRPAPSRLE
jgi:acetylornithine/succinyldiaminopimelate/putrescine aminotransferase/predicted amino acid dehydrogenase